MTVAGLPGEGVGYELQTHRRAVCSHGGVWLLHEIVGVDHHRTAAGVHDRVVQPAEELQADGVGAHVRVPGEEGGGNFFRSTNEKRVDRTGQERSMCQQGLQALVGGVLDEDVLVVWLCAQPLQQLMGIGEGLAGHVGLGQACQVAEGLVDTNQVGPLQHRAEERRGAGPWGAPQGEHRHVVTVALVAAAKKRLAARECCVVMQLCHDEKVTSGGAIIGRQDDVAAVARQLRAGDARLVSVVGAGGIGKTTLAQAVVEATRDDFESAITLHLASAFDTDDIGHVLARQLGNESVEALHVGMLSQVDRSDAGGATKPSLVVLDNCETARQLAAEMVEELTSEAVVVLATSRVPLGVQGEQVHLLEPLALPAKPGVYAIGGSPAVQLFVARARAAGATWEATEVHLEAISRIVKRLDGMPLAIELAAARSRTLGPADLVELLDRQLDVLNRPSDDRPERHHSIRAAINASYDPLDDNTKRLFRTLSLVRSAVDLDFVTRLSHTGDKLATVEVLETLVDESLVVATDHDGVTLYRLLEPIRAYGLEQLDLVGETAAAEGQLIDAVTRFADDIVMVAMQNMSAETLDSISDRSPVLLAAIEAALRLDDTPDRALRLYLPFYAPTPIARSELAAVGSRILERWPDPDAPFAAEALAVMAHSSMWAGDDTTALDRAQMALDHPAASSLAKVIAHRVRAFTAGLQGDRAAGVGHIQAAMEQAQELGGAFSRELRMSWASMLQAPDRSPEALAALEAAAAEAAEANESVTLVWAAVAMTHHHVVMGNYAAARRATQRALEVSAHTGAPWAAAAAHRAAASVTVFIDGWEAARDSWSLALESEISVSDLEGIALTVRSAAAAAHVAGQSEVAEALWTSVLQRRGVSALPELFARQEAELHELYGQPYPLSVTDAVSKARAALAVSVAPEGASPAAAALDQEAAEEPGASVAAAASSTLHFDDYELDLAAHELRLAGERVHIEPQVFDVLAYLAQQPGRMIPKEELLDEIWGDRFVSPSALTSRIKSARAATGDDGKAQRVIRTVHGRGFMWVAELR